jgi:hypothetical protein
MKIRTRYQRMSLAMRLAEMLKDHWGGEVSTVKIHSGFVGTTWPHYALCSTRPKFLLT